ncbi:MAG: DUF1573 domain-containing protein [Planctomycetaceae bacterium]
MQSHLSRCRVLFAAALAAAALLPVSPAAAQDTPWARKMFNATKHDFGVVARGAKTQYRFKIKNIYKETVNISNVTTTCGCSAARPTKRTLKTYETAEIVVTMNTERFVRRKDSNLIVTFDRPYFARVTIPITAYIRTDVVLAPGAAVFGAVEQGKSAKRDISISYAGRRDWKIKSVKAAGKHIAASIRETSRNGGRVGYTLTVTLTGSAPVGTLREQVVLVTNDANSPNVPVAVTARVESDITVTVASLGTVRAGRSTVFNVVVRGRKPFRISGLKCKKSPDCFQAKIAERTRIVHVLPVTFTPPATRTGPFTETLQLTVVGRPQPVTFQVSGRIAAP